MSVGTAIFFAAVLVSAAILFAATKDRWNWKRIGKWSVLVPLGVVAVVGGATYLYFLWESRPTPLASFTEIPLNATPADVRFIKGAPTKTDGPDRWIYNVGTGSAPADAAQLLVQFEQGRIRFVLYTASDQQIINPWVLGFSIGSSYEQVLDKLGQPSHVANSADELDRMFSYGKYNTFFSFRQARLVAYGIYQPSFGPMAFRNAAAASTPATK